MPRRAGDEDLLTAVRKNGKTLLDVMWEELDVCIEDLMDAEDLTMDDNDLNLLKGRSSGIAWCIAVLTQSPRPVDVNAIKEEAMERWTARQAEE